MTTSERSVRIERVSAGRYVAHNDRGGTLPIGGDDFSPVELLLAAIGGCTAIDTDVATSRRTEPTEFTVAVSGDKVSDRETGNRMENLSVTFHVRFPEGEQGDAARAMLPRTVALSHDKLCTVSRTVERGTPVRTIIE
ncbi:oxidoreductase [Prauserella sp. PE36]|uniref:OsmC family protein n=1 Tax=Prauserella endophytica TaxID=1592324 RepID=A0ABY2S0F8_9PSEU|nr:MULTISPECIES: OsmC family protein [Prauserella]PXY33479.1 oxidoreductase [Prauserella coralliicola]RBM21682.1 oxidoreductase [Prauserella sp. PE36]TKG65809.1 OsmC family protein [Prauserella endophytica]